MSGETGGVQGQGDAPPPLHRRRLIRVMVGIPLFCCVFLFLPAGTLAWGRGWGFFLCCWIMEMRAMVYLERTNPALLTARSRFFQEGTKPWDKVLLSILLPVVLTIFPLAAVDNQRFQWSAVPWCSLRVDICCCSLAFGCPRGQDGSTHSRNPLYEFRRTGDRR